MSIRMESMLVCFLGISVAGCASSGKQTVLWQDAMNAVFDGSAGEEGDARRVWTEQDEERLLKQMGYSDAVAVATCRASARYDDRERPSAITLVFTLEDVLYDRLELDRREDLRLTLSPGDRGFSAALDRLQGAPGSRYLLFIKRARGAHGQDRLRWAFYRPGPRLLAEVRGMYRMLGR